MTQDETKGRWATMYGAIYTITNKLNGKQYVGQTTQPIEKRWAQHVTYASIGGKKECSALWNAIRKYGPDAFDVEVIATCDTQEELDRVEVLEIKARNTLSPGGYNLQTGGGNGKPSAEVRAKMSAAQKGKKRRPLSLETRAKMSAARKGKKPKPLSPEARAKLSAALVGKTTSQETRTKISERLKGHSVSPETRTKMSATRKERHTHETTIMTTVRDLVREYRKSGDLSLRKFAAAVGCSHEEVRNWEAGSSLPNHRVLMPLLRGEYGDWRTRFAVDVLAALYPKLIKPVGDGHVRSNRVKTNF